MKFAETDDLNLPIINPSEDNIDWSTCIICQQNTTEKLQCPALSTRTDIGIG